MLLSTFVALGLPSALGLACTCAARAVHVEAIMVGIESVESSSVHESCKIGVTHLLDLATSGADEMSVRQADAFILGLHALKHVPPEHLGLHEQLDGIVDGGPTHPEPILIQHVLQLLDSEVPVDALDAVEDSISLGSLAHAASVQIVAELAHYRAIAGSKFLDVRIGSHRCDKITTIFAIPQRFIPIKQLSLFFHDMLQCQLADVVDHQVA